MELIDSSHPNHASLKQSVAHRPTKQRTQVTQAQIAAAQDPDALLSWPTVSALCELGESTIRRLIAAKKFPTPIRLSSRCTRFRAGAVREWLAAQASQ